MTGEAVQCSQSTALFTFSYDFLLLYAESSGTTTDRHAIILSWMIIPLTHSQLIRLAHRDFRSLDYKVLAVTHSILMEKFFLFSYVFTFFYGSSLFVYPNQALGPVGTWHSYISHSGPIAPHMNNAIHNNLARCFCSRVTLYAVCTASQFYRVKPIGGFS